MKASAVSAIISMTLKVVGNKLAPLLIREYSYIVGVKRDLLDLRDQVEEINCWLETKYEARNDPSFNWLQRLKDIAYAVDDVIDEFQLNVEKYDAATADGIVSKYMWRTPKSFILQCKAASKIKTIKKKFDAIVKQRADFSAITNSLPFAHPVCHMNKTSFEMSSLSIVDATSVLGRDQDKDKIITKLITKTNYHDKIEIISVIGLGGSGKTTLAKLIFSDEEIIKNCFEFTLWVHVSQEFNVTQLIKKLFEVVTKEKSDKYPFQYISEEISGRLNGKIFLLVLDDVWTEDRIQWEQFMVHLKSGSPRSRILLTTRTRTVAEAMESTYIFDLPFLSLDDSWQLFHRSFGAGAEGLNSEFQEVGKEIVKKCGGVPLAIKSLECVLHGKERIEEWRAIRDNNLLDVERREHRVAACLMLSYFHLPYHLKQCFIICSVFPKGHKIRKDKLIDLWIAHDMITIEPGVDYLDYIGHKCFNSLVKMSFLQDVEVEEDGRVTCRMHDLVHDLAQSIADNFVSKEGTVSTKSYRYFSLTKQVRRFLSNNLFGKTRAIYVEMGDDLTFGNTLKNARHLRCVTLESMYAATVPKAIFQVKNLKYLDIVRLKCEALPEAIVNCWNLQALHVASFTLTELPKAIGKLRKLRTLDLSECFQLKCLPDSIGDCRMISSIDLCDCASITELPDSIKENWNLRILRLGNTGIRRLPSNITRLSKLECLDLHRCYRLEELPLGINDMCNLRSLNLRGCTALVEPQPSRTVLFSHNKSDSSAFSRQPAVLFSPSEQGRTLIGLL